MTYLVAFWGRGALSRSHVTVALGNELILQGIKTGWLRVTFTLEGSSRKSRPIPETKRRLNVRASGNSHLPFAPPRFPVKCDSWWRWRRQKDTSTYSRSWAWPDPRAAPRTRPWRGSGTPPRGSWSASRAPWGCAGSRCWGRASGCRWGGSSRRCTASGRAVPSFGPPECRKSAWPVGPSSLSHLRGPSGGETRTSEIQWPLYILLERNRDEAGEITAHKATATVRDMEQFASCSCTVHRRNIRALPKNHRTSRMYVARTRTKTARLLSQLTRTVR